MKPVGIISASPSLFGGVRAQFHLRQIMVAVNAIVTNVAEIVITEVNKKLDQAGNLIDEKTRGFISKFILSLAAFTEMMIYGQIKK